MGARLAVRGIAINAALGGVKISAGLIGNSYALVADGIESLVDIAGSMVIWTGLKFAAKPPDATHPYGHGKAEPMAAGLVALGVMGVGAVVAAQCIREIMNPEGAPAAFTLWVLAAVVIVKEGLYRRMLRESERGGSLAVKTDAWHHRADAITSAAAFAGIGLAVGMGPGWQSADDWAALVACGFILFNGFSLLKPAVAELLDTAPDPDIERRVRNCALGVDGVGYLDKCRVRKMGLEHWVELHVRVDGGLSVSDGHTIAHQVKDAVRTAVPTVADVLVHIEPA